MASVGEVQTWPHEGGNMGGEVQSWQKWVDIWIALAAEVQKQTFED